MADVDIRVVHATVVTGSTFQDITVTNFGDCVGALFYWSHADQTGGLPTDHAHFGHGAVSFAGTDKMWAMSYFVEQGGDPTNATHMGATDRCIQFSNTTGSGVENNMSAIASQVTDGLRISWQGGGNPGTARRFTVVMFGGTNCHVEAGTVLNSAIAIDAVESITLIDMAVRPELVFVAHGQSNGFSATVSSHGCMSIGFGADHAGTITQFSHGWKCADNRNQADRHGANLSSTHIASVPPMTGTTLITAWELTATGVNGTPKGTLQITKRLTAITSSFGYFAYSSDGNNLFDVHMPQLPYTAGTKDYTDAGFQPQATILYPSNQNNVGVVVNAFAVGLGASAIDEDTLTEGMHQTHHEEVDGSNVSSSFDAAFINVKDHIGSGSVAADFFAFTSTGFSYVPTNTDSNTKPAPVCCIGIDTTPPVGRNRSMVCS